MILALRLLSRPIIDEGKPKSHRAVLIKFPVLIAIGAEPVASANHGHSCN
jgi:hypothetical protein